MTPVNIFIIFLTVESFRFGIKNCKGTLSDTTRLEALRKCQGDNPWDKFVCVPYYNCDPHSNSVIQVPEADGSGIIGNLRNIGDKCNYLLEVCCKLTNDTQSNISVLPTTENTDPDDSIEDNKWPICGNDKSPNWMVEVIRNQSIICVGSLITPSAILIAAHCFDKLNLSQISIRANDGSTRQEQKINQLIIHEYYVSDSRYYDVAILIIESPFKMNSNLSTICLPSLNDKFTVNGCFAVGVKPINELAISRNATVVDNWECQKRLRLTNLGQEFILHESFLCGASETCMEFEGPLICPSVENSNRYFQIGIFSWDVDCNNNTVPITYTDVAQLRNWIDEKLIILGYRPITYEYIF